MHGVAVPERIGTIGSLWRHQCRVDTVAQRLTQVFGQTVRDIDAETVHAAIAPECEYTQELMPHLGIVPIEVRLLLGEQMQVVPAVSTRLPCGTAEVTQPVGRRQFAVLPLALPEHIPLCRFRFRTLSQGLLEPTVLIGRVVRHDVHDDADTAFVRFGH